MPHPSGFPRATRNSSHVNTRGQSSSCRIAAQQALPHHVQPLLWHVSTGLSDLFAALASTRRHRLGPSTALERINSPHSQPEPWDSALCHGQQRNSPQSKQEHVPSPPVLGGAAHRLPPPPQKKAPFISFGPAGLSKEDDAPKTDFSLCQQSSGALRHNLPTGLIFGQPRSDARGQGPKSPLFLIAT